MTAHLAAPLIGLAFLATMTTACSAATTSGSRAGESTAAPPRASAAAPGEGSALPRESAKLAKGELIGTGVGAAAGAIYEVKKRSPR